MTTQQLSKDTFDGLAKPPLLAWPVNWIRNICYELDLFWCIGKAVKNPIAVARVKALVCRSWLGLVGCPPPESVALGTFRCCVNYRCCHIKPPHYVSGGGNPTSWLDYLASDGRSGTRGILGFWPLVPLTPCCLFVLCGGYNMFFYAEQILFECSVPSFVRRWCDLRILCMTLRNVCF